MALRATQSKGFQYKVSGSTGTKASIKGMQNKSTQMAEKWYSDTSRARVTLPKLKFLEKPFDED